MSRPADTHLDKGLISTCLFKNSTPLYQHAIPILESKYPKLDFQEIIATTLPHIIELPANSSFQNPRPEMFGSTRSFKDGPRNNLIMYYAKDFTPENDTVSIVTITDIKTDPGIVFSVLNKVLNAYTQYSSGGNPSSSSSQRSHRSNNSDAFQIQMNDIINNADYSESSESYGSIKLANDEIDQVRTLMNDNIERVLQRGERIHLLVSKTDKLNNASHSFRRRTIAIKRRLWWNNVRFIFILILCGIILAYFVGGEICGFPLYQSCFRHQND